jgi:predicted P-loop ATPase
MDARTDNAGTTSGIAFIKQWFGATEQPVYLCSLANDRDDSKEPTERHVSTRDSTEVDAFITKWDRAGRGLFFCVSTIRAGQKRNKENVSEIPGLWADIDFKDVEDNEATILKRVKGLLLPPSVIVRSGNGLHCHWKFKEPLVVNIVDGVETIERVEAALKLLADLVGGDQKVTQVAALMRMPGTHNSKRDSWKLAEIEASADREYEFSDIEDMISIASPVVLRKARPAQDNETNPFSTAAAAMGFRPPIDVEKRLAAMTYMGGNETAIHGTQVSVTASLLNAGTAVEEVVGLVLKATVAAAGDYGARWNWRREECAIQGMCDTWIKKHPPGQKDSTGKAASRKVNRRTDEPNWRECRNNGSPLPSMHNARLGINALGIKCSRDTFHNKTLFGFGDDAIKHELQSLLGEVTDDGIIALRQKMSDKFGFDLEDKATRDAVRSLALENCFDPVRNLIDKAEADWDCVKRLDQMAVTHFNCADTPLNRAFLRKTIIAMVARAREPGCKFDTITVLESAEGYNKSTAWRVMAGDENFSDEPIIGKASREVQEQLAEIWLHENADLAGMKKAEVETVKAFASRTTDIARAAFAHYVVKQPRHSIEVGSTNSEEYLQSQTGNRRFWPLPVLKAIDIALLRRDRQQLIGEAATYQSAGESITLDEAMWPDAAVVQEGRRVKDAWEDILEEIPTEIEVVDYADGTRRTHEQPIRQLVDDGASRVASLDLLTHVLGIPLGQQTTVHSMRLSVVMKRLGWERGTNRISIRGKQVRGFSKPKPKEAIF